MALQAGTNQVDFGRLREGDANNDNFVTLEDFSILVTSFGKGESDPEFDERADFNTDHFVSLLDFSLLISNFGQAGDTAASTSTRRPQPATVSRNPLDSGGPAAVQLIMQPATTTVQAGQTFEVPLIVQTGTQPIDGAAAYLTFDPTVLQVERIQPGNALTVELTRQFDNTAGRVAYAAGTFDRFPTGTLTLGTITFRALTPSAGTALTFNETHPRKSNVTFGGTSILGTTEGSQILVQAPACPDFDGNGRVDTADVTAVSARWRLTASVAPSDTMPPYEARFDLDHDQTITVRDIALLTRHWGESCE